jgi:hypothetical protein
MQDPDTGCMIFFDQASCISHRVWFLLPVPVRQHPLYIFYIVFIDLNRAGQPPFACGVFARQQMALPAFASHDFTGSCYFEPLGGASTGL